MITAQDFKKEVEYIANQIGLKPKEIHLRKMKRKLASCSSKGRLTFNIDLLIMPKEERYKIIIHEILHMRYPNHGKMFKLALNNYLEKILNTA